MMKHVRYLTMLSILVFAFTACSDDDNDYEGVNEVFLKADGEKTLSQSEDKMIDITVQLTRSLEENVSLTFEFENTTSDKTDILEFVTNPVSIKAGEKTAKLQVKSKKENLIQKNNLIDIKLKSSSVEDIKLNAALQLTVKPDPSISELDEAQLNLLEGYLADGLDLTPWIGVIPVEVKVTFPGGGYLGPFTDAYEKVIKGQTPITLSKYATAKTPALVMTENAMGLEEYIYEIFKQETILDTEFWTQQPAPQKAMELTNLTKDSKETFQLALDSLVFDKDSKSINFVRDDKAINAYGDKIAAVAFDYSYSAWDRMQKLIDAANQEAIEAAQTGGTLNPDYYINITAIDEDGWDENNWIKPGSSFDNSKGEMKFIFNFDHVNAGDYIKIEVTFTKPESK